MGRRPGNLTAAAVLGLCLLLSGVVATAAPGAPLPPAAVTRETARLAYTEFVLFSRVRQSTDVADVVAADGSGARLLAGAATDDAGPSYSPDGSWVVFGSRFTGADGLPGARLLVAAADGSGVRALEYERAPGDVDLSPVWSPDGTRIAFVRTRDNWDQVWVVEVGPDLAVTATYSASRDPFSGEFGVAHRNPSWGPDSRHVVLESTLTESRPSVAFLDVETGIARPLAFDPCPFASSITVSSCGAVGFHPAWSPDGSTLAVANLSASGVTGIALVPVPLFESLPTSGPVVADWGDVSVVPAPSASADPEGVPPLGAAITPAWSPDGEEVAFASVARGRADYDIFAVAVDGDRVREVVTAVGHQVEPAYQPWSTAAGLSVRLEPPSADAWLGGVPVTVRITVANEGPGTAEDVRLTTTYPGLVDPSGPAPCLEGAGECELGAIAPGDSAVLEARLSPGEAGRGEVTASVVTASPEEDTSDNRATAAVTVHRPVVEVLPTVGRPGDVVVATGEEFPPGSEVRLRWSRGFTPLPGAVTVDGSGRWQVSVLVARWDVLGERLLLTTSAADPVLFGPVEEGLTVVPASLDPPRFLGR